MKFLTPKDNFIKLRRNLSWEYFPRQECLPVVLSGWIVHRPAIHRCQNQYFNAKLHYMNGSTSERVQTKTSLKLTDTHRHNTAVRSNEHATLKTSTTETARSSPEPRFAMALCQEDSQPHPWSRTRLPAFCFFLFCGYFLEDPNLLKIKESRPLLFIFPKR